MDPLIRAVKQYFEERHGAAIYPSDVAEYFDISREKAEALLEELENPKSWGNVA